MATTSDLKHSIISILKHNRDGSYKTQANRKERLLWVATQLGEGGYKIRHIQQLKPKHVQHLVNRWLREQLNPGTIKNRMTDLRWVLRKLGKESMIPSKNDSLNIPRRQYLTDEDKSITLSEGNLAKVTDMNTKMSLLLQRAFGLRREESIKIRIHQAVVGDELHLRGSWCKNGRGRVLQIRTLEQWQVIEQVKKFIGKSQRALIPSSKKYVQQETLYNNQVRRAGIHKAHGLRHAYAQQRYQELTGWLCPAKGGPRQQDLSEEQRRLDKLAREMLTADLGHNRSDVVSIYCGK